MSWLRNIRGKKLRNKCIAYCLLMSIVPIIILGTYSYTTARKHQVWIAEQGLDEAVRQIAESMNEHLESYGTAMQFIVANSRVQRILSEKDTSPYTQYLNLVHTLDPMIESIYTMASDIHSIEIYNGAGLRSRRSYLLLPLETVVNEPWFQAVQSSVLPRWSIEDNILIGTCRFPPAYHVEPNSVLRIAISLSDSLAPEVRMAGDYYWMLRDKNGELVYTSNPGKSAALLAAMDNADTQGQEIDDTRYYFVQRRIVSNGWTLCYAFNAQQIGVNVNSILWLTVLLIILSVTVVLLLAVLLTRELVVPVEKLNQQIQRVRGGEMNLVVRSGKDDELGELTNQFGDMLSEINRLIEREYKSRIVVQEAEMRALRAQINPHFLYNTLSTVNWMAIQSGDARISKIINSLSRFYRSVLNNGSGVTTVRAECENIRYYLDIQLAMHDDPFDVMIDIDEDIEDCEIINLILQPIVENAIEHGIDQLDGERGALLISGSARGDLLQFSVEDNGPGISEADFAAALKANGKGYGLSNVYQRIQAAYGSAYGMRVDPDYTMGARIIVEIPKTLVNIDIHH